MLSPQYRERRGIVELLGVPPAIAFALINHFTRPEPSKNKTRVYGPGHETWIEGTSKSGKFHVIRFSYMDMNHVKWAFPLHLFFPKEAMAAVRLVAKHRFCDPRMFGTPVQFKYRWPVEKVLGVATQGLHMFTISANIGAVSLVDALPRWNYEYLRWTVEQQTQHLLTVQEAITSFPSRPLRQTHSLKGVPHPLAEWATQPIVLPAIVVPEHAADPDQVGDDASSDDSGSNSVDSLLDDGAESPGSE